MKTIYKYEMPIKEGIQAVPMTAYANIIKAEVIHNRTGVPVVTIWAEVDPDSLMMEFKDLIIYGTGHAHIKCQWSRYIATMFDHPFVWHLYEVQGIKPEGEYK